ncbi:hypothetical protein NAC44_18325 [Allorhizobium sp. BGMRC 0089]|uniref:hypothetical protein n=1 Tax=Allorhizobium sonneratiae TaxID=2934936 RepID=UPI0020345B82|nr:hypothetical protein [Allorhizobium sonneratiae]MCM2294287.1 hypothetical protein [Allorhizobium sonneratiae]
MNDVLVVLGMHRSGTSSVSGVLTRLGGSAPKNIMAADEGNPRGYYESTSMMIFNDDLLSSGGSRWEDWRAFNPEWYQSPVFAEFHRRAKDLVLEEFGNTGLAILKDPRICRFFPFWRHVLTDLDMTTRVVIPVRSPVDVANSLKKIHGMPIAQGLLLWLRHVLDAEYETRSLKRSIFSWKEFRKDWKATADKISKDINLVWPNFTDRSTFEIERFLSSDLVHFENEIEGDTWAARAYKALIELAHNPTSNSAMRDLDDIRSALDEAGQMFGPLLIGYEVTLEDIRARHSELQKTQQTDANELEVLRSRIGALDVELAQAAQQSADLRNQLDALRLEHDGLQQNYEIAARDVAGQSERLALLQNELQDAEVRYRELESQMTEVQSERLHWQKAHEASLTEISVQSERIQRIEFALAEAENEKVIITHSLNAIQMECDQLRQIEMEQKTALEDVHRRHQADEASRAEMTALLNHERLLRQQLEEAHQHVIADMRHHIEKSAEEAASAQRDELAALHRVALVNMEAAYYQARKEAFPSGLGKLISPKSRKKMLAKRILKSGLFDADFYCEQCADVSHAWNGGASEKAEKAALHYLDDGYRMNLNPNRLFDSHWYLDRYEDVRRAGINPLLHYMFHGWQEGRNPGPNFNTQYYLDQNEDVRIKGVNPLVHYLKFGYLEGRLVTP